MDVKAILRIAYSNQKYPYPRSAEIEKVRQSHRFPSQG
jgi:hypothetical protein